MCEIVFHIDLIFLIEGYVNILCDRLNIPRPTSRAYHPESQGKVERSHATWKKKLVYDISNNNLGKLKIVRNIVDSP